MFCVKNCCHGDNIWFENIKIEKLPFDLFGCFGNHRCLDDKEKPSLTLAWLCPFVLPCFWVSSEANNEGGIHRGAKHQHFERNGLEVFTTTKYFLWTLMLSKQHCHHNDIFLCPRHVDMFFFILCEAAVFFDSISWQWLSLSLADKDHGFRSR